MKNKCLSFIVPEFWSLVQVAEFKRLLGVKPTPKNEYLGVPVVTHDRSLKLPKEFDARTTWSQCTSIGRILGHSLASFIYVFFGTCYTDWLFLCFVFNSLFNYHTKDQVNFICLFSVLNNAFSDQLKTFLACLGSLWFLLGIWCCGVIVW